MTNGLIVAVGVNVGAVVEVGVGVYSWILETGVGKTAFCSGEIQATALIITQNIAIILLIETMCCVTFSFNIRKCSGILLLKMPFYLYDQADLCIFCCKHNKTIKNMGWYAVNNSSD